MTMTLLLAVKQAYMSIVYFVWQSLSFQGSCWGFLFVVGCRPNQASFYYAKLVCFTIIVYQKLVLKNKLTKSIIYQALSPLSLKAASFTGDIRYIRQHSMQLPNSTEDPFKRDMTRGDPLDSRVKFDFSSMGFATEPQILNF